MNPTRLKIADLGSHIGEPLGTSGWVTIGQDDIEAFANATGDHQWVHVDETRAAAGPFGATIAHGFMLMTVTASLFPQVLTIVDRGMSVNYGTNRVRFVTPVRAGSQVRLTGHLTGVDVGKQGSALIHVATTLELRESAQPAAEAELLFLVHPR